MIKYVENILNVFPRTTTIDRMSNLSLQFKNVKFSPKDITEERCKYKELTSDQLSE